METIKLWLRNGDAVRQAIELGELVHLETASEELTDEFLLCAIQSGLLSKWAEAFPDPRCEPEISMEVLLASHLAARFAGLYAMRKSGDVLRKLLVKLEKHVDLHAPLRLPPFEPSQAVKVRERSKGLSTRSRRRRVRSEWLQS